MSAFTRFLDWISTDVPTAGTFDGTEKFPVIQSLATKRTTLQAIADWVVQTAKSFTSSGTGAVSRPVSNKLSDVCHLFDFVEPGLHAAIQNYTSAEDVTTEFTAAIAQAVGEELVLPSGLLNVSNLTISVPVVIRGKAVTEQEASGKTQRGTTLKVISGTTGSVITISKGATYLNDENQLYGVALKSLFLDGADRGVSVSAIDMSNVDRLLLEDVNIQHFLYQALRFNTSVRESWFHRVRTRFCGSIADSKPCIDLQEQNASNDAHNNLWFQDCQIIYSMGTAVQVAKKAGSSTAPRNINFIGGFVHGLVSAVDGLPYTLTSAQKQLNLLVVSDVSQTGTIARINSVGTRWFSAGDTVSAIHLDSSATNALLSMTGGEITAHYASTGNYDGLQIEAGVVIADSVMMKGHNKPVNQTGGEVYLSPSCYMTGNAANPVFAKNTTAVRTPVYLPRFAFASLPTASLYDAGTAYFASTQNVPVWSDGTNWWPGVVAKVDADNGDAGVTVVLGTDSPTQVWNTPLTADRGCTLSTSGAYSGGRFRVVRTASATGASNLNVGTGPLKALAAGQWCDVEYNGSAWILTAFGSL